MNLLDFFMQEKCHFVGALACDSVLNTMFVKKVDRHKRGFPDVFSGVVKTRNWRGGSWDT